MMSSILALTGVAVAQTQFSLIRAVLLFAAMAVTDVIWGLYIRRIGEGKSHQAAIYACLLWGGGAFIVVSYLGNFWYIPFIIVGSYLGTWLSVHYDHKRKMAQENN
jgi:hypothetical protein